MISCTCGLTQPRRDHADALAYLRTAAAASTRRMDQSPMASTRRLLTLGTVFLTPTDPLGSLCSTGLLARFFLPVIPQTAPAIRNT